MLRRAALALLLATCAWLLAQGCVLLWQAGAAVQESAAYARGGSPFVWDFAQPDTVVADGSEGLSRAQRTADGLVLDPRAQVTDLSLPLGGRAAPLQALPRAELTLRSDGPVFVRLLAGALEGPAVEVGGGVVPASTARIVLAIEAPIPAAEVLRLRIEAPSGAPAGAAAPVRLQGLRLLPPALPDCAQPGPGARCAPAASVRTLAPQPTPELFLRARDRALAAHPAAVVTAGGVPDALARAWAATRQLPFGALALAAAVGVFGWAVWARLRDGRARPRQLALLFAVPVVVLVSGAADAAASAAFLLCCAAALVHPGGRHDWRWIGDAAAWRAAARMSVAGVAVIGLAAAVTALGGEDLGRWRWERLPRYAAWALLQQALLLVAIAPRTRALSADPWSAALIAGGMFALLHTPNFALMLLTLVAGTAWARLGERHRALLPLAASHWLLGSLLVWAAPPWLLRSAEIGGRYLMPPG